MGKHFDGLVELVKNHVTDEDKFPADNSSIKNYLRRVVEKTSLFEFPLDSPEIFSRSGKEEKEYDDYIDDYINMSKRYGKYLITPFELTGIEDKTSAVFLDNIVDNRYYATTCLVQDFPTVGNVVCSRVDINKEGATYPILVRDVYMVGVIEGVRYPLWRDGMAQDLVNAITSYIEQLVYIMDPDNFIIRKENTQSIQETERTKKKGKKKSKKETLRKTIMRPHYVALSEEDTIDIFRGESKEPRPIHPVRGHWKELISERYRKMRGQKIFIEQYFRGKGEIEGKHGWHYQVLLKKDPVTIVPLKE